MSTYPLTVYSVTIYLEDCLGKGGLFDYVSMHPLQNIGKISLTSPIVTRVPTRASLAVETKDLLFLWLGYLNAKAMFVNRYLPYT